MAIIVVEGIDRVGKTTIANMIQSSMSIEPYLKFGLFKHDESFIRYDQMDSDNEADKMSQLLTIADTFNNNIMFDRFHLSDFVYGVINRGYKFSNAYSNMLSIDNRLSQMQSVLVYVRPVNLKRSSGEHGSSLEMHHRLMEAAFEDSFMNKIAVDYSVVEDDDYFYSMMDDICMYLKGY